MVRPHRVPTQAQTLMVMPRSRPRLFRPPWTALFHIEIPEHAVPDDVFDECVALAEWLRWLHLHVLRARHQGFEERPFQGHGRSIQGLRPASETRSQTRGVLSW